MSQLLHNEQLRRATQVRLGKGQSDAVAVQPLNPLDSLLNLTIKGRQVPSLRLPPPIRPPPPLPWTPWSQGFAEDLTRYAG